jgi:hypothetical protein
MHFYREEWPEGGWRELKYMLIIVNGPAFLGHMFIFASQLKYAIINNYLTLEAIENIFMVLFLHLFFGRY